MSEWGLFTRAFRGSARRSTGSRTERTGSVRPVSRLAAAGIVAVGMLSATSAVSPAQAAVDGPSLVVVSASLRPTWAPNTVDTNPTYIRGSLVNQDTGKSYPLVTDAGAQDPSAGVRWAYVPDGRYKLSVWQADKDGQQSAVSWWPGVYSAAAAKVFTLRADVPPGTCDPWAVGASPCWALSWNPELQGNRSLAGSVLARDGRGLAGRTVTVTRGGEPQTKFTAVTSGSGDFAATIPPGEYEVSTPNGDASESKTVVVTGATASTALVMSDAPSVPRDVVAAGGSRRISVTWTAPSDTGGRPIDGYRATVTPGGHSCQTSRELGCSIDGLVNNKVYTVTVTAGNPVGWSAASAPSNTVTPLDPAPTAPRDIRATSGDQSVVVLWSPPLVGADTITGYRVTSSPGGHGCTSTDLSCQVTGLVNGQAYVFRVVATTSGGDSAASEPTSPVTPAGRPTPPRSVNAEPGARSVRVTWNASIDDGGAPIGEYTATAWPSGRVCTANAASRHCAIGGLKNGTAYSITVTATNRVGTSERSPGSIPVTPKASLPSKKGTASAVALKRGSASPGRLTVKWSVPAAPQVIVAWQRLNGGPRQAKPAASKGKLVLKGVRGTAFRVKITGVTTSGQKLSKTRVFAIR